MEGAGLRNLLAMVTSKFTVLAHVICSAMWTPKALLPRVICTAMATAQALRAGTAMATYL